MLFRSYKTILAKLFLLASTKTQRNRGLEKLLSIPGHIVRGESIKSKIKAEWTWFEAWGFITISFLFYFPAVIIVITWKLFTESSITQSDMAMYIISWLMTFLILALGFLAYQADSKLPGPEGPGVSE